MNTLPRPVLAALLVAAAMLSAGCLAAPQKMFDWTPRSSSMGSVEPTDWEKHNWWGYKATFKSGKHLHVALVVSEETRDFFVLGTNSTSGFFGLPFAGNVTRADKNPVIAGEEWKLFQFPLAVGKKWEYTMLGYPALADVVGDVEITLPGIPKHQGFRIEAFSYGQLFARYTYSPVTKWFTELTLYEPTNGEAVVTVELKEFGRRYTSDFYVQVPLEIYQATFPALDDGDAFRIEGPYKSLTTYLSLRGELGEFRARLRDPGGSAILEAEVHGQGAYLDRKTVTHRNGEWEVEHLGLGKGTLRMEIYGLAKTRAGSPLKAVLAPDDEGERVDFAGLLGRAAPAPAPRTGALPPLPVSL
ncbi:MAG TPA: hypothetical protein VNZ52_13080 [Candidatus Thermoplasmatota archaeon]|nr:hypothetical protein [Candidatus Thermoplasmatota archaeon]